MKKLVLFSLSVFLLLSFNASAQIKKGSVLLGGGISGNEAKSGSGTMETKGSSYIISPSVGVAVKDNTIAGLFLSYNHSSSNQGNLNSYKIKQNTYGGGLFYRKYYGLGKGFFLFGEGNVFYQYSKYEQEASAPFIKKSNSVGFNVYPGLAYAVSRRFHLEIALSNLISFNYFTTKGETLYPNNTITAKNNGFSFSTNLSTSNPLSVGFRVVLGK
jgi:hypothetical protein